jgi:cytochrome oxidase Cu insertion factor (SCO1/SenC/PrrC family)
MNKFYKLFKYLFIPAISLVITFAIYNFVRDKFLERPVVKQEQNQEALIGGPFSLTNQDGKVVSDKDYLGKYMLVYFGFTNCPMICPGDMLKMTVALAGMDEAKKTAIQPIFITIDPKRDTVQQIKLFANNYADNLQLLTGTSEQIASVANNYRIYYKQVESTDLEGYLMDHSSYMYLMGPDGKYIAHFTSDQSAEDVKNKLNELVK